MPLITMKGAAGKYLEDAWVPFAFAIINLVASILFAKPFGVSGVFLGTIVGSLLTADWYRPIVIYIIYCRLTHPELVLLLRLFRKIKSKLGNL